MHYMHGVWVLPRNEGISVFKVGVEVGLVDDGAGLGFDARLLVRQRQLVQHVDVGQGVGQSHFFGHFAGTVFGQSSLDPLIRRNPSSDQTISTLDNRTEKFEEGQKIKIN